jgi:hypothetical protein
MPWRRQVPIMGNMKQAARAVSSWMWSSEMAVAASLFWGSWSSGSNWGLSGAGNPLSSRWMAWAERYQSLCAVNIGTFILGYHWGLSGDIGGHTKATGQTS